MTPADKLIDWTARWTLLGNHVLCIECMTAQAARDVNQPFVHVECRFTSDVHEYPWRDLRETLNQLPVSENN